LSTTPAAGLAILVGSRPGAAPHPAHQKEKCYMRMVTRRARIGAAALACVLPALGACGGSDDKGKVKSTVNGLYEALAAKDAGKVCGSLTASERRKIEIAGARGGRKPVSCPATLRFAFAFAGDALKAAKDAKVTQVSVKGSNATATVAYMNRKARLGLTKEGGDWKVSNLNLGTR
jgi:hypothetical protein